MAGGERIARTDIAAIVITAAIGVDPGRQDEPVHAFRWWI
jgi:hypothetical protein